jgi:hypothetical protein
VSNNQLKMKRTRIKAGHLDQHFSFPVFARSPDFIGTTWQPETNPIIGMQCFRMLRDDINREGDSICLVIQ